MNNGMQKRYTGIKNSVLDDNRLSWKAKGVLVFLMSVSSDFEPSIKNIAENSADGYTATRSAVQELEDLGYIERQLISFSHTQMIVHEVPKGDEE